MKRLGIDIKIKNVPALDKKFIPITLFRREFLKNAAKPVTICVERDAGQRAVYDTFITGENRAADQ